jgi:hypothetical protein
MTRKDIKNLIDIPNIGKSIKDSLVRIGIQEPLDLVGKDPYQMYSDLCNVTSQKCDPCILDIFISAVRYMEGGEAKKWWEYTTERKKKLGSL